MCPPPSPDQTLSADPALKEDVGVAGGASPLLNIIRCAAPKSLVRRGAPHMLCIPTVIFGSWADRSGHVGCDV